MIYDNYERTASGMVYVEKSREQVTLDRANKIKCFLLHLIEEEFELSFRSQNCLDNAGIKLVGQLLQKSASELLELRNFGRTSLGSIERDLREKGLSLDMSLDFFPWNGKNSGDELIRILSLQKSGGGFLIDERSARSLGIDLDKLNQGTDKNQRYVHTQYLLDLLESRFGKDRLYLIALIQQHRKWMEKFRDVE